MNVEGQMLICTLYCWTGRAHHIFGKGASVVSLWPAGPGTRLPGSLQVKPAISVPGPVEGFALMWSLGLKQSDCLSALAMASHPANVFDYQDMKGWSLLSTDCSQPWE